MERVGLGVTLSLFLVCQYLTFVDGLQICLTRETYNFLEAKLRKITSHFQSRQDTKHVPFVAVTDWSITSLQQILACEWLDGSWCSCLLMINCRR